MSAAPASHACTEQVRKSHASRYRSQPWYAVAGAPHEAALPRWADLALIPALNLLLAFLVAGLVVLFIGENPIEAMRILLQGSLGSSYAIGFTLYYATTFVFTGLVGRHRLPRRACSTSAARARRRSAASG